MGGAAGEHLAGFGQAAAASGSLDEPLAGGGFEQAEVLTCARLSDPDRGGRGREAAVPLDLDEQAHACGVPQLAQHAGRSHRV